MDIITLRLAAKPDAQIIANLSRKTFQDTFSAYNTKENMEIFLSTAFSKKKLIEEVESADNIFYLAFLNNQPAGYLKLMEEVIPPGTNYFSTIEISRIYVDVNAIGKGVGKAMMDLTINIAMEKKKHNIWLGVWEYNRKAIDFYQQYGFEKFGTHIFMLGHDAQTDWLMMKKIES